MLDLRPAALHPDGVRLGGRQLGFRARHVEVVARAEAEPRLRQPQRLAAQLDRLPEHRAVRVDRPQREIRGGHVGMQRQADGFEAGDRGLGDRGRGFRGAPDPAPEIHLVADVDGHAELGGGVAARQAVRRLGDAVFGVALAHDRGVEADRGIEVGLGQVGDGPGLAHAGDRRLEILVRRRVPLQLVERGIPEHLPPRALRDRVRRRGLLPRSGLLPRRRLRVMRPLIVRTHRAPGEQQRGGEGGPHLGAFPSWGSTASPSRITVPGLAMTVSCSARPETISISVPKSRPTWTFL